MDVRFPEMNGLDFQDNLLEADVQMPVIIMSGHADVASTIRGMKSGAADFLIKPFDDTQLLSAVVAAFEVERLGWEARTSVENARLHYALLTNREREVLAAVAAGLMNKQIAAKLGLSEVTVKIHRGTMMRKMGVSTLADLVRVAVVLEIGRDD